MNRQSIGIVFLVIIVIGILYFFVNTTRANKLKLAQNEVSSITICKADSVGDTALTLDVNQRENFIKNWDNSISIGYNRISCSYYLHVYLINGKQYALGVAQDHISEHWGGGDIYTINDKNYFDSLFAILKAKSSRLK